MPPTPSTPPAKTSAAALLEQRDRTEQAIDRIDKDPEEALNALEQAGLQAAPNVGEITQADMFRLMAQMQGQMAIMQNQIVELTSGRMQTMASGQNPNSPDLKAEIEADRRQRDATLEAWRTEPREPVYINPDQDEEKIYSVTGAYPPRIFGVNGIEFPIQPGEVVNVPQSIAVLVRGTQRRRPMQTAPQHYQRIEDPQHTPFLAGSQSIAMGRPGIAGAGPIQPESLPPPMPLGPKYDHLGQ